MSATKIDKKTSNDQDNSSPLLDMSQSSVKKMMAQAKARGYITYDELNEFMRRTALYSDLQQQIGYTLSTEAVSTDFVGSRQACVFDSEATIVKDKSCVLYCWYDNGCSKTLNFINSFCIDICNFRNVRLIGNSWNRRKPNASKCT